MLSFSIPLWRKVNIYHKRKRNKANTREKELVQSKLQANLERNKTVLPQFRPEIAGPAVLEHKELVPTNRGHGSLSQKKILVNRTAVGTLDFIYENIPQFARYHQPNK